MIEFGHVLKNQVMCWKTWLSPAANPLQVFFGMQGFCLDDLQRVVLNEAHLDSSSKPLLSLEFEEGRRKGDRPPRSEGHEG